MSACGWAAAPPRPSRQDGLACSCCTDGMWHLGCLAGARSGTQGRVCHLFPSGRMAPGEAAGDAVPALAPHLWRFRGRLLFLISSDLMCSARRSSCLMHQCRRMLVVNWSSGWQGRLSTIFTISSLGLWGRAREEEGHVRRKDKQFVPRSAGVPCSHCRPRELHGSLQTWTQQVCGAAREPRHSLDGTKLPQTLPGTHMLFSSPSSIGSQAQGMTSSVQTPLLPQDCWQAILLGTTKLAA